MDHTKRPDDNALGSKILPEDLLWGQLREEDLRKRLRNRYNSGDPFAQMWKAFESHVKDMVGEGLLKPEEVDGVFMPCFVRPGPKYEARLHRKYRTALRLLLLPKESGSAVESSGTKFSSDARVSVGVQG